jgi:hypothetical protein
MNFSHTLKTNTGLVNIRFKGLKSRNTHKAQGSGNENVEEDRHIKHRGLEMKTWKRARSVKV